MRSQANHAQNFPSQPRFEAASPPLKSRLATSRRTGPTGVCHESGRANREATAWLVQQRGIACTSLGAEGGCAPSMNTCPPVMPNRGKRYSCGLPKAAAHTEVTVRRTAHGVSIRRQKAS